MPTPEAIANEALRLLCIELGNGGDRFYYSAAKTVPGEHCAFQLQVGREVVVVEIDHCALAPLDFNAFQALLDMDAFSPRFLGPAAFFLAQQIRAEWQAGTLCVVEHGAVPGMDWQTTAWNPAAKLALTVLRWYDIRDNRMACELRVLFGVACPVFMTPFRQSLLDAYEREAQRLRRLLVKLG
jgi:hypothetical protein